MRRENIVALVLAVFGVAASATVAAIIGANTDPAHASFWPKLLLNSGAIAFLSAVVAIVVAATDARDSSTEGKGPKVIPLIGMVVSGLTFLAFATWYFRPQAPHQAEANNGTSSQQPAPPVLQPNPSAPGGKHIEPPPQAPSPRVPEQFQAKASPQATSPGAAPPAPPPATPSPPTPAECTENTANMTNAQIKACVRELTENLRVFHTNWAQSLNEVDSEGVFYGQRDPPGSPPLSQWHLEEKNRHAVHVRELLSKEFEDKYKKECIALRREILPRIGRPYENDQLLPEDAQIVALWEIGPTMLAGPGPVEELANYLDNIASQLR